MIEVTDVFQILLLIFVGIICGIQIYYLVQNLKKPPLINQLNQNLPTHINLPTPYSHG